MDLDLDLLASIAAGGLGRWTEGRDGTQIYVRDDDCIACLKDLQTFIRGDDPEQRPAFFAVSQYNFARSDLVPLIVTYPGDYDVVFNSLKVCAFLTMASPDIAAASAAQEATCMQQVCEAFLARDALAVIVGLLAEPLSRHPNMSERDGALVQLVIAFLRNLLAAVMPPEAGPPALAEGCRRTRAGLLRRLLDADVMDLIILMAQHAKERPFRTEAPVLVDIFLRLFSSTLPAQLLDAEVAVAAVQHASRHKVSAGITAEQQDRHGVLPVRKLHAHLPPRPGVGKSVARYGPSRQQFSGAVYVRRHLDHCGKVVLRHAAHRTELPGIPAVTNPLQAKAQSRECRPPAMSANIAGGANHHVGGTDVRTHSLAASIASCMRKFLDEAYAPLFGQVLKDLRHGLGVSQLSKAELESFVRLVTVCTQYVRLSEEQRLRHRSAVGGSGEDAGHATAAGFSAAAEQGASPFACISTTLGWDTFQLVQQTWALSSDAQAPRAEQKAGSEALLRLRHAVAPLLKEMLLALDLAHVGGTAADRCAADRLLRRLLHNDAKDSGLLSLVVSSIKGYNCMLQPRQHAVDLVEVLHLVLGTLDHLSSQSQTGFRVTRSAHVQQAHGPQAMRQRGGRDAVMGAAVVELGSRDNVQQEMGAGREIRLPAAAEVQHAAVEGHTEQVGVEAPEKCPREAGNAREQARAQTGVQGLTALREVVFEAHARFRKECARPALVQFYVWLLQGYHTNTALTNHALVSFLNRIALPDPAGLGLEPMLWQFSVLRLFHSILTDKQVAKAPAHTALVQLCSRVTRSVLRRVAPDLYHSPARRVGTLQDAGEPDQAKTCHDTDVPCGVGAAHAMADLAPKMAGGCASMMCVELLFWKDASMAEHVDHEYSWQKVVHDTAERSRHPFTGVSRELGFVSYRTSGGRAGAFTEAQTRQLHAAFEQCNGFKDCLSRLVRDFGGAFKKSHVSRQLKVMALERGKFTASQSKRMLTSYQAHANEGPKRCFEMVAEELAAGFTANQVKGHLKHLGAITGGGAAVCGDHAWEEMLATESDGDTRGFAGRRSDQGPLDSDDGSSGPDRRPATSRSPHLGASYLAGSSSRSDVASGGQAAMQSSGSTGKQLVEHQVNSPSPAPAMQRSRSGTPKRKMAEVGESQQQQHDSTTAERRGTSRGRAKAQQPAARGRRDTETGSLRIQQVAAMQHVTALEAMRCSCHSFASSIGSAAADVGGELPPLNMAGEDAAGKGRVAAANGFVRRRLRKSGNPATATVAPDRDLDDF